MSNMKRCPECGNEIEIDSEFCYHCGCKLRQVDSVVINLLEGPELDNRILRGDPLIDGTMNEAARKRERNVIFSPTTPRNEILMYSFHDESKKAENYLPRCTQCGREMDIKEVNWRTYEFICRDCRNKKLSKNLITCGIVFLVLIVIFIINSILMS